MIATPVVPVLFIDVLDDVWGTVWWWGGVFSDVEL